MGQLDFLPVLLGSDVNVYGMARSFHEAYGVKSIAVGKGRLNATSNLSLIHISYCIFYLSIYILERRGEKTSCANATLFYHKREKAPMDENNKGMGNSLSFLRKTAIIIRIQTHISTGGVP